MDCVALQTVLFLLLIHSNTGQTQRCACTTNFKKCASIHEIPADFQSAQFKCRSLGGELMRAGTALSNDTIAALLTGTDGYFWAGLETKGKPRCLSVSSVKKWTEVACKGILDGFLCNGVPWDITCWMNLTKNAILLKDGDCSLSPCDHNCDDSRYGYTCTCVGPFRPGILDPRRCEYYCLKTPCNKMCTAGCRCPTGFVMDGDTCTDIDECTSNHDCDQRCTNALGSYRCSCSRDYVLVNGSRCVPTGLFNSELGLPAPTAAGDQFINPALNYTSGRVVLASPGEYVGITVFLIAALIGAILLVRYLRTRKSETEERLKDSDVLDNVQQAL